VLCFSGVLSRRISGIGLGRLYGDFLATLDNQNCEQGSQPGCNLFTMRPKSNWDVSTRPKLQKCHPRGKSPEFSREPVASGSSRGAPTPLRRAHHRHLMIESQCGASQILFETRPSLPCLCLRFGILAPTHISETRKTGSGAVVGKDWRDHLISADGWNRGSAFSGLVFGEIIP